VLEELKRLKESGGNLGQVVSLPGSCRPDPGRRRDLGAADVAHSLMVGGFPPPAQPPSDEDGAASPPEGAPPLPQAFATPSDSSAAPPGSSASVSLPGRSTQARQSPARTQP